MISQSFTQVVRQAGIESVLVALALQDIDVEERCHVSSLACRVVARCVDVARLNVSAFAEAMARQSFPLRYRCEGRLEARGFEPLTSSLQSWRSTN